MTDMEHIASLAGAYADARQSLEDVAAEIQAERRKVVRPKLRRLKKCIASARVAREQLHTAIEAAPELFEAPRTRAFEGVKVGYRKLPGRVDGDGDPAAVERVVARIHKHLPDHADALIRTTTKINRAALKQLDGKQLARIGITITAVDDEVVIAAASSDLDKLVDALMVDDEDAS